ncbi:MAG: co-chaperone YbbN [Micavibrio sp.]|nr:co-chaperone YbbN [Micavibrio sp.]
MIFGSQKTPQNGPAAPVANSPQHIIFDATANDFEQSVLQASMEKPVLVDFWAPWCGPCKQMMPVLEKAVNEAGGAVLLAKVNLDENPELAQALRVQSVPTVFAFFGGRPVEAFQGNQPESQIKAFIASLIELAKQNAPEALNIPESLKAAADALAEGNFPVAQGIYADILEQEEGNADAFLGLIRTMIAAGNADYARQMIDNAPDPIARHPKFIDSKAALEMALKSPASDLALLIENVAKNPDDQQARLDLAEAQFAAGEREEAIETLLASIAIDREWNEQAARKMLVTLFQAIGNADPLTIQSRKKLSSLLFS